MKGKRYGRLHHDACLCDACERAFKEHNRGKQCDCDDCWRTRNLHALTLQSPTQQNRSYKVATVNFCERCETMGKSDIMGRIAFNPYPGGQFEEFEICPGCVGDFIAWKNTDDSEFIDRPKAYKHKYEPPKANSLNDLDVNQLTDLLSKKIGEQTQKLLES